MVGPYPESLILSRSGACPQRYSHTCTHRFKRTEKRNEIFIATKFGAGSPSGKIIDGSPAYVKEACQKSLEKLGVDQIDLYYAHRYAFQYQLMPMSWMSDAVIEKGGSYCSH